MKMIFISVHKTMYSTLCDYFMQWGETNSNFLINCSVPALCELTLKIKWPFVQLLFLAPLCWLNLKQINKQKLYKQ